MKTVLAILTAFFLTSCYAHMSVNPTTGSVEYTRWGGQQISGLDVVKDGDLIKIKIESLRSEKASDVIKPVVGVLDD